jgi:N-sulfoglucosamine sulfohydrolase
MQGRALLGEKRKEPAADEVEFLFADRFDETYGMRRGITDGKWKYIRNFNPHLPQAPYSYYHFGQPGWQAYQKAWKDGKLSGYHKAQWERPTTSEFLYDLTADPWEINNLASDPAHSAKLSGLRAQLKTTMLEARDTGIVPEPMFAHFSEKTIADVVQSETFDLKGILEIALKASAMDATKMDTLRKELSSEDPVKRYWALVGLITLGEKSAPIANDAAFLLKDTHPVIRATASELLYQSGFKPLATSVFITEVSQDLDSSSLLYLLNTLDRLNLIDELPKDWHKGKSFKMGNEQYIKRFVKRKGEN